MSRRPARFTQARIRQAVKAVQSAGCEVASVDISEDGAIRVHTVAGQGLTKHTEGETLDPELAQFRREHGYS